MRFIRWLIWASQLATRAPKCISQTNQNNTWNKHSANTCTIYPTGGMFSQQMPAQQFQQPMSNVGPFSQPLNHSLQSQMGMSGVSQMNAAANQMCMNPNQMGNPMTNSAAMAMQAQMVSSQLLRLYYSRCRSIEDNSSRFAYLLFASSLATTLLSANSRAWRILVRRWSWAATTAGATWWRRKTCSLRPGIILSSIWTPSSRLLNRLAR